MLVCFFTGQVVGGASQRGSRGGYPAEYHPMTAEEHRLWNLKLQADMVGRAASKAMSSQHLQQRSVDYERQIQVLRAALGVQREAEAAGDRRVEEAPATPSSRVDTSHTANAQPSSPPGLPSEYYRRTYYPASLCSMEVQVASTPSMPSASPVILLSGNSASAQNEGDQSDADKGQSVSVAKEEVQALHENSQCSATGLYCRNSNGSHFCVGN